MKNTNMLTTKTLYILATILGLQFNAIFATGNFNESTISSVEIEAIMSNAMLMPSTPAVATFEEIADINQDIIDIALLSPDIPMAADFTDGAPATEINLINLAPVTPKEAVFEETTGTSNAETLQKLAPVTPAFADFEDVA